MPTNDPHPTARALVEAWEVEAGDGGSRLLVQLDDYATHRILEIRRDLEQRIALALTAGRREGREEMRERAAQTANDQSCMHAEAPENGVQQMLDRGRHAMKIADAIRQLPLDDAARGEEKGKNNVNDV